QLAATWKREEGALDLHLQGEGEHLPKQVRLQLLGARLNGQDESVLDLGEVDLGSLDCHLTLRLAEPDWRARTFELTDQAEISYPLKS
ncbi:alpha-xylosidase, partial [Winkia sp. UMB3105]|nr:alpha-xylosidase [Winkia sp. UMB3105]